MLSVNPEGLALQEASAYRLARVSDQAVAWHLRRNCSVTPRQLALNQRLGTQRVAALHALLDTCIACLDEGADGTAEDAAAPVDESGRHRRRQTQPST